jgi:hypothetical protein
LIKTLESEGHVSVGDELTTQKANLIETLQRGSCWNGPRKPLRQAEGASNGCPRTRTRDTSSRSGTLSASDERDSDQAWFWTDEWQAKEREADEALRQGRFERFESEEAFEAALEARQHLNADT